MDHPPGQPARPLFSPSGWQLALARSPLVFSVLLLFFLPFLTQTDGEDPIYPKLALTQILVLFILCAWVLKILMSGRLVWIQTTALPPLAVFLAWAVLTLPFSSYAGAGWLFLKDWICFPLWYLLTTLTCYESWKAENLLVVFLASALGTCGWAAAQEWGVGGGPWLEIVKNHFQGRVAAGLGNPDFLAGYLLLVWPLALALYLKAKRILTRVLWSGLLLSSLLALMWTGSKAGFLGLVVGALVYAFCYYGRGEWGRSLKKILATASATILVLIVLSFFSPMAGRLGQLTSPQNESVWFRATVWKGVMGMIRSHPLQGTGIGTFVAAYPSYRPPALMMRQAQPSYQVDHAHNWVLEWTAETGLVGLGLGLWFCWCVFGQWWRLFSANAIPKTFGAGVFAVFAGSAVDNFFDVNSALPSTLVPLLLLAALPVALSQRFFRLEGFPIRWREIDLTRRKALLAPVGLLVMALAVFQVGRVFHQQIANLDLKKAETASQSGKWDEAIALYGQALQSNPDEVEANYFRGAAYFDRGKEGDFEKALLDLDKVARVYPDYVLLHFKKYEVLSRLNRAEEAKAELQRAIRLDPMLIFLLDDFKRARELVSTRRFNGAFMIYQNLYFDYPNCVPMIIAYANAYALSGDYASALNLYRRALELDPGNEKALKDQETVRKALDARERNQGIRNGILGGEIR